MLVGDGERVEQRSQLSSADQHKSMSFKEFLLVDSLGSPSGQLELSAALFDPEKFLMPSPPAAEED